MKNNELELLLLRERIQREEVRLNKRETQVALAKIRLSSSQTRLISLKSELLEKSNG